MKKNDTNTKQCYIIAEAGLNHNGEFALAKRLVEIAIETGCNAVKFQKRTVNQIAIASVLDQPFTRFQGFGNTQREVRERVELSKETYRHLRQYCRNKIDFMVTPFDIKAVDFLDDLDIDSYKIASHNNTDIPLLKAVAKRKKPVFVSLGMCNENEIDEIVSIFKKNDLTLMYCVSRYPVQIDEINLNFIPWLKKKYNCTIGYSDHENGITIAPIAFALGAKVIEKHFTLDKTMVGFDHHMSLDPEELRSMVKTIRLVEKAVSRSPEKRIQPCETAMYDNRRRSLFAARPIKKGERISEKDITVKEPLIGLTPRMIPWVVGKTALYNLETDEPITFGVIA